MDVKKLVIDAWNAFLKCLKNWSDIKSRADRTEFWSFIIVNWVIAGVISAVFALINLGIISKIYSIVALIASISVSIRRMNDIGKSPLLVLLWFVPVVGWIIFLYFAAQPSKR